MNNAIGTWAAGGKCASQHDSSSLISLTACPNIVITSLWYMSPALFMASLRETSDCSLYNLRKQRYTRPVRRILIIPLVYYKVSFIVKSFKHKRMHGLK